MRPTTNSLLSKVGSLHLKFIYLSDMTDDYQFRHRVIHVRNVLNSMIKPYDGLYYKNNNSQSGKWCAHDICFSSLCDSLVLSIFD